VLKQNRWFVHQRSSTPRPRVRGWVSRASRSNERWAMEVTHIPWGQDGWAHLAAVIDGHDRALISYEFALRSRAKEAERAVEAACLPPAVRDAPPRGRASPPRRQWPDFPAPPIPAGLSRLPAPTGIHYAVYAGAEWDDRTVFSESQRRVCLAAHVPDVRRGAAGHSGLGPVVQLRATASSARIPQPHPVSCATINPGGLISGEHYTPPPRDQHASIPPPLPVSLLCHNITKSKSYGYVASRGMVVDNE
jgi:hypothetical protein